MLGAIGPKHRGFFEAGLRIPVFGIGSAARFYL